MRRLTAFVAFTCALVLTCGCEKLGLGNKPAEPMATGTPSAQGPKNAPTGPRATLRRVPCLISLQPLVASLRVDLQEVKGLILDAQQIYREIVDGEPSAQPPAKGVPVIMVVNKKNNKFTYFQVTPHVKEIRLRSKETQGVEMVVHNKEPLHIELWINSDKDIEVDVEFKESATEPKP
ncbi:MAG: hypothetical protein FJ304_05275 [Planctomycetes bacterium]|nr:hypothetical protein [Planctomycetota bacterium]